jgi:hypothetical protein
LLVANDNPHHHQSAALNESWIVNNPVESWNLLPANIGRMNDMRQSVSDIQRMDVACGQMLSSVSGSTDGENVDMLEHFFWGQTGGISIEMGALDGTPATNSMTHALEDLFGWKRILIEGDPRHREGLKKSTRAFSANVAICENHRDVHFASKQFVGGILEFMAPSFLKIFYPSLYAASSPPGNVSSINWNNHLSSEITVLQCLPLSVVLHHAHVHHINLFILDVEGAEVEVLKSIRWDSYRFDVLCVENDPSLRPAGFGSAITAFLLEKGYIDATGQQGRNTCKH